MLLEEPEVLVEVVLRLLFQEFLLLIRAVVEQVVEAAQEELEGLAVAELVLGVLLELRVP